MSGSPASPSRAQTPADESHIRVSLTQLAVQRADGSVEDDFKTWSEVVLLGGDGVPDAHRWYAGEDVNLGRTSVTNGNDAAYNYARASKAVALTEGDVTALVASTLVVRGQRWKPPVARLARLLSTSLMPATNAPHAHNTQHARSWSFAAARATLPQTRSLPPAACRSAPCLAQTASRAPLRCSRPALRSLCRAAPRWRTRPTRARSAWRCAPAWRWRPLCWAGAC